MRNSNKTTLAIYDLGERISSVWPKFDFKIRKDHGKKFPISAASMSRWTIGAYLRQCLKIEGEIIQVI